MPKLYLTPRGHALVWIGAANPHRPILTIENYMKWYDLWLIHQDGHLECISFALLSETIPIPESEFKSDCYTLRRSCPESSRGSRTGESKWMGDGRTSVRDDDRSLGVRGQGPIRRRRVTTLLVFILGIIIGAITCDRLWLDVIKHRGMARGKDLDRLAMDRVGLKRKKWESDKAFRKRITDELNRPR